MKQIAPNTYVERENTNCNLGLIKTSEGIVLVDTPMWPSNAVWWRDIVNAMGEIRYVINTEEHRDHCANSFFFPGLLITSQATRATLAKAPLEPVLESVKRTDPKGFPLMEGFKMRLADIAFTGNLEVHLGNHTFQLFPLPGHSPGGIGVFVPEERVAFTTDCVFHHVKSWLHEANPEVWLESLKRIGELDVAAIVGGHGDVCDKAYLHEQADIISQWVDMAKAAIKKGLSEEEAFDQIKVPDPHPKQEGTPFTEPELNKKIISRLYKLYAG
ncbi:MAG: MBL fold metallo-hydrolase [Chloroflexota bacterium]